MAEEIQGLDIGEHGNSAYPEFLSRKAAYSAIIASDSVEHSIEKVKGGCVNETN